MHTNKNIEFYTTFTTPCMLVYTRTQLLRKRGRMNERKLEDKIDKNIQHTNSFGCVYFVVVPFESIQTHHYTKQQRYSLLFMIYGQVMYIYYDNVASFSFPFVKHILIGQILLFCSRKYLNGIFIKRKLKLMRFEYGIVSK